MQSYPCVIVGLADDGRASYVGKHVHEGDVIDFRRDTRSRGNPHAVGCYHHRRQIGHLAPGKSWIARSIAEGDVHRGKVTDFYLDEGGRLAGVDVEVEISRKDDAEPGQAREPALIDDIGDELRILAMVASADGRFQTEERGLIEKYAGVRAEELGVTYDDSEIPHAVRWARRNAPTNMEVTRIVRRLAKDHPGALQAMWEVSQLVAEMDGKVQAREAAAVNLIRDAIIRAV